jgi:hypothetical protein
MSVSISPTKLPDVFPDTFFSQTITVTGANGSIGVTNTDIIAVSSNTAVIKLANGITSCTANGSYVSPFNNIFSYVLRNRSNILQRTLTANGSARLPAAQEMFDLDQDLRIKVTKEYRVIVRFTNSANSLNTFSNTITFDVNQDVINDLDRVTTFVENYHASRL